MKLRNLKTLERLAGELEALQHRIDAEKNVTNIECAKNRSAIEGIGQAKRALLRTIRDER